MKVDTVRFGTIDVAKEEIISFRAGLIGFPSDRSYVLIPHGTSAAIAWLQSTTTPGLAFPVVSAHGFVADYPDVPLLPIARRVDVAESLDDLAVLVVLSATRGQPATVNLLAPLIINSSTRHGAQVFLEGSRFSTRELFTIPDEGQKGTDSEPENAPTQEAQVG